MGHRAGLDRCGKSRPPPRLDPRTVQPVATPTTLLDPPEYLYVHAKCTLELASDNYMFCSKHFMVIQQQ